MYVVVVTRNKVQRWQVVAKSEKPEKILKPVRVVNVIDNGGTPFIVELSSTKGPGTARILVHSGVDLDNLDGKDPRLKPMYRPWKTLPYERVWIGLDPNEKTTTGFFSKLLRPGKVWWHGGNSILLQVAPRKYISIGRDIFKFSTPDDILEYFSPMGNSAVPYPYAVGTQNTYLLTEKTWIPNVVLQDDRDPYGMLYQTDLVTGKDYTGVKQGSNGVDRHKKEHKLTGYVLLHKRV